MAHIEGRVQRCDNGNGIAYCGISDNLGNSTSCDQLGFFRSDYAYPGYVISASAYGYTPENHVVSQSELTDGWVTICLVEVPPTNTGSLY